MFFVARHMLGTGRCVPGFLQFLLLLCGYPCVCPRPLLVVYYPGLGPGPGVPVPKAITN